MRSLRLFTCSVSRVALTSEADVGLVMVEDYLADVVDLPPEVVAELWGPGRRGGDEPATRV